MTFNRLKRWWTAYKYRFVPWIAVNLKHRSIRSVTKSNSDKLLRNDEVEDTLKAVFYKFLEMDSHETKMHSSLVLEEGLRQEIMEKVLGFSTHRKPSNVAGGGIGVFVKSGMIPKGCVSAMYPGTIYLPGEPILFQSIGNPFIFRCIDGILLDGNDKGISKFLYRVPGEDFLSRYDLLSVVRNANHKHLTFTENHANVAYQEFDVPQEFPFHLRQYIPNIYFNSPLNQTQARMTRTVVLVSTRDIYEGEELYSSYFTVVH